MENFTPCNLSKFRFTPLVIWVNFGLPPVNFNKFWFTPAISSILYSQNPWRSKTKNLQITRTKSKKYTLQGKTLLTLVLTCDEWKSNTSPKGVIVSPPLLNIYKWDIGKKKKLVVLHYAHMLIYFINVFEWHFKVFIFGAVLPIWYMLFLIFSNAYNWYDYLLKCDFEILDKNLIGFKFLSFFNCFLI